ncbi:TetR/AcrR family transcriptional regulator [Actinomadura rayongensis]|uniref:TetR family transcriptional regulator n=1 Tax=Actinomadura rayongensis TaxID=1429076 RepID=A0A6I4WDI3_9ACTN|nr:TetR/AcrR family transcriptional regulator [Actinomadura rayongensis]MXQ68307.1 TetR family transcriptional regulator [Actinomadura rayongensis]
MPPARPLRADARQNESRLLEVAARAFAREGPGASLKAIAQEAGVGIGTLYRRFPSRETLIEAVYRTEVDRLCATAPALLDRREPLDALREWMERFVDFMAAKQAMGDALRAVLTSEDDRMRTRGLLRDALAVLLRAGAERGTVRDGVDAHDLLLVLGGIALIAEGPDRSDVALRLLGLVIDGVRA